MQMMMLLLSVLRTANSNDKRGNTECYIFSSLMRDDENGGLEPDGDKIDEIANNWLFLD